MFDIEYGIRQGLALGFITPSFRVELEAWAQPFLLDRPELVFWPRCTTNELSIQFCGLEIMRIRNNTCLRVIQQANGAIQGCPETSIANLQDITTMLRFTSDRVADWRADNFAAPNCPGMPTNFGKEHWCQSLIVADGPVGWFSRDDLGLPGPHRVVTQVPVGYGGANGPQNLKIDIVAVLPRQLRLLEIKIDDAWTTAKRELRNYTDWLLGRPSSFSPGNQQQFIQFLNEDRRPAGLSGGAYLPQFNFPLTEETIFPIAVLRHGANRNDLDGAGLPPHPDHFPVLPIRGVMRLPPDWRHRACQGQSLFFDPLYP